MLYSNEARINKNRKIAFGSDETRKVFTIINPLKGSYSDLESKLKNLLEVNNTVILKVKFSSGKVLYFSYISAGEMTDYSYNYVVYETLEDAMGRETESCNVTVGIARDWPSQNEKYKNLDISICGAIKKGM